MQKGDKVLLRGRFLEVVKHDGALVQVTPEGGEEYDYFWVKSADLKPAPCPKKHVFVSTLTSASVAPPPPPALTKKAVSRIVAKPAVTYTAFAPWLCNEDYKLHVQVRSANEALALAQYATWSGEDVPDECITRKQNDTTAGWQRTQQWVLQFPYNANVAYPFPIVESGCGGGLRLGEAAGILNKRGKTVIVSFVSIIEPLVRAGLRARR